MKTLDEHSNWVLELERPCAGDLVTVVRYRIVIEEKVLTREEFDKINNLDPEEHYPNLVLDHETKEDYQNWQYGCDEDFIPTEILDLSKGYMVFDGNITDNTDDYVYSWGKWQTEFPLTVV